MIPGFDKFEAAFLPHRESFILIGGTAVQMVLGQYETAKGLKPEALLVFKIIAYLNLMEEYGQTNDARRKNDALKHRNDVFRVLEHIAPDVRAHAPQELAARIREFLHAFDPGGTNYREWVAISQAIASPYLALDPTPLLLAYRRLFDLQDSTSVDSNSSLQSLAHTWAEDPVSDRAISEMRTIDKDLWKEP